jgi:tight adherence protein B
VTWIFLGLSLFVALLVLGAYQLVVNATDQRQMVAGGLSGTISREPLGSRWSRVSERFNRTRVGRSLERDLQLGGISYPPLLVLAAVLALTAILPYLLAVLLAPIFGVLGLAAGYLLMRAWLRQARERRRERFVQQIPELARVLSNATNAGLSIATAWSLAELEMAEPAKTEIQRLNSSVRFGSSMEEAMLQLNHRLPAREVRVLMSTLVVSARSGGSLVKALRDISMTLDDRKEVRREVQTTLAQARATSVLVTLMGFGILLALNAIQPGTVDKMTKNLVGQIALVVSFSLFGSGLLLVRRMTRAER